MKTRCYGCVLFSFSYHRANLRRGTGLVRDAEFGSNSVRDLVVFVFDLSVSLFWVFRASMGSCS